MYVLTDFMQKLKKRQPPPEELIAIRKDVTRTFPDQPLFNTKRGYDF